MVGNVVSFFEEETYLIQKRLKTKFPRKYTHVGYIGKRRIFHNVEIRGLHKSSSIVGVVKWTGRVYQMNTTFWHTVGYVPATQMTWPYAPVPGHKKHASETGQTWQLAKITRQNMYKKGFRLWDTQSLTWQVLQRATDVLFLDLYSLFLVVYDRSHRFKHTKCRWLSSGLLRRVGW
jgi:hypothetical protein